MKKILITENQLKKLIENILIEQDIELEKKKFYKASKMKIWFLENVVDKVKQITNPKYPDSIYYVDKNTGQTYMEYNQKNGILLIDYDKIWSYFKSNYSSNDMEIKQLIKDLMGEHYNLWDVTPTFVFFSLPYSVLEHYNLWDVTPVLKHLYQK